MPDLASSLGAPVNRPRTLVTIGIPTYQRPEMLRRALESVRRQDYSAIEVIIADNATPGDDVTAVVDSFRAAIPRLELRKHRENIGAFANFFSLLDAANGEYFMWLADDDEISPNYVSGLAALLDANPDAASAAGHWVWLEREGEAKSMPTASFPQRRPLERGLRFIWRSDDAFFYGLHRLSTLRQASFPGYWWPNRGILQNWGYVYLLDMVLRGRVLLPADPSVQFINHDYTSKHYASHRQGFRSILRFVMRRVNVHCLYLRKSAGVLGLRAIVPVAAVTLAAFVREQSVFFGSLFASKAKRLLGAS